MSSLSKNHNSFSSLIRTYEMREGIGSAGVLKGIIDDLNDLKDGGDSFKADMGKVRAIQQKLNGLGFTSVGAMVGKNQIKNAIGELRGKLGGKIGPGMGVDDDELNDYSKKEGVVQEGALGNVVAGAGAAVAAGLAVKFLPPIITKLQQMDPNGKLKQEMAKEILDRIFSVRKAVAALKGTPNNSIWERMMSIANENRIEAAVRGTTKEAIKLLQSILNMFKPLESAPAAKKEVIQEGMLDGITGLIAKVQALKDSNTQALDQSTLKRIMGVLNTSARDILVMGKAALLSKLNAIKAKMPKSPGTMGTDDDHLNNYKKESQVKKDLKEATGPVRTFAQMGGGAGSMNSLAASASGLSGYAKTDLDDFGVFADEEDADFGSTEEDPRGEMDDWIKLAKQDQEMSGDEDQQGMKLKSDTGMKTVTSSTVMGGETQDYSKPNVSMKESMEKAGLLDRLSFLMSAAEAGELVEGGPFGEDKNILAGIAKMKGSGRSYAPDLAAWTTVALGAGAAMVWTANKIAASLRDYLGSAPTKELISQAAAKLKGKGAKVSLDGDLNKDAQSVKEGFHHQGGQGGQNIGALSEGKPPWLKGKDAKEKAEEDAEDEDGSDSEDEDEDDEDDDAEESKAAPFKKKMKESVRYVSGFVGLPAGEFGKANEVVRKEGAESDGYADMFTLLERSGRRR